MLSAAYEYVSRFIKMPYTCERRDVSEEDVGEKCVLLRRVSPVSYHGRIDEKGDTVCKDKEATLNTVTQDRRDSQDNMNEREKKGNEAFDFLGSCL